MCESSNDSVDGSRSRIRLSNKWFTVGQMLDIRDDGRDQLAQTLVLRRSTIFKCVDEGIGYRGCQWQEGKASSNFRWRVLVAGIGFCVVTIQLGGKCSFGVRSYKVECLIGDQLVLTSTEKSAERFLQNDISFGMGSILGPLAKKSQFVRMTHLGENG